MPLPTDYLSVRFYINSGITIVCEGNHRMLAFKLTGITDFPLTEVKYFDDYMHSSELNEALLAIEKWFPNILINNIPDDPKDILQIYHDLNKNNVLLRYLQHYVDLKERLGIVDIKLLSVHIELYKFILLEKKEFFITRYLKKIFLIDDNKYGYYEKWLISGMKHWMEHDIKK
ncbi:hypothetical protein HDF26_004520 [Pedobacter cryoconitis]|uniref:hypothetical protein n=1 Tax=Pedobacter cryoconitis TaxID=188932 RepID=UPI00161DAE45|nr:hypothetical protein [Pedobacter cryoconitis]MBB6274047.1 hypothetical protein [Pedobacter cryoconitis]